MRLVLCLFATAMLLAGCGDEKKPSSGGPGSGAPGGGQTIDALSALHQSTPLDGAKGVDEVKKSARDGEAVVVEGRICDFVEGIEAANIMDLSLPP